MPGACQRKWLALRAGQRAYEVSIRTLRSGRLMLALLLAAVLSLLASTALAAASNASALRIGSLQLASSAPIPTERGTTAPVSGPLISLPRFEHEPGIHVDGHLDEPVWDRLPALGRFRVVQPVALAPARYATRVRTFYTDAGLYVGIEMEQPRDTLIARLSSRDRRELNRDSVSIMIDSSGEGRYGYYFTVNLGDSLADGTILPERQLNGDWDGPWHGASAETEHGWSAEMFLPWSMMSMPARATDRPIGIYVERRVAHLDELWSWPALPDTEPRFLSAFYPVRLSGVDPRQQYSVFPFASTTYDRITARRVHKSGADVFWRPSSAFQLMATLNPDFGNVEADHVVVNLGAFETFFSEKRLFFLEGQEIFVTSPRQTPTLLNTRRIGGPPRAPENPLGAAISAAERQQGVELVGALKTTGESGPLRYGVLTAMEDETRFRATLDGDRVNLYQYGSDYAAARLLYEDNPGGGYRGIGWMSTATRHPQQNAYTHGVDLHWLSPRGEWKIDGQLFYSDVEHVRNGAGAFVDIAYMPGGGVSHSLALDYFDEHVNLNHLGFLRRDDVRQVNYAWNKRTSNAGRFRNSESRVRTMAQTNSDHQLTSAGIWLDWTLTRRNLSRIKPSVSFYPERYDDRNARGHGVYRIAHRPNAEIRYLTDTSRRFSTEVALEYRTEDLGGQRWAAEARLRLRPSDRFSMELQVPYSRREGWLLHQLGREFTTFTADEWRPRLETDFFITARQQLRFTLQWVGIRAEEDAFYLVPERAGDLQRRQQPADRVDDFSISTLSLQFRYRWEIAPLSDLFIVYTRGSDVREEGTDDRFDAMFTEALRNPLTDQLVIKLRYRFGS
jgi:hypothetical protein